MKVTGIMFAMLDIPPEFTAEYNRWYDLDHLPEHISKPDVLTARRYVAPRDLQEAPAVEQSELTGGFAPYATIYLFGVEDFDGPEALEGWRTKDRGIVKDGRYWREGRGTYARRWRLAETFSAASVLVAPEAVPYIAHRGVIVAIGRAPSAERRSEAVDWWRTTYLVDLLALPGILGALRLDPTVAAEADLTMHVLLCSDDPAIVMTRIADAQRYLRAIGRYPAFGGLYEPLAFLPYRTIVPYEYDFDFGPPANPGHATSTTPA
jgi:hypothetical protein